ncbi:MAG: hypothetical protein GKR87_03030 [Kiritimatiellae bacterium]|nr:hypothetical protein [Kiritimatiellia bacterium]
MIVPVYEGSGKSQIIFRLKDHYQRLINSARIYNFSNPYTVEELIEATIEVVKRNELNACYIRPLLYDPGVAFQFGNEMDCIIAAVPTKPLEDATKGISCKVSSWARIDRRNMPLLAKCTGNYANIFLPGSVS